MDIYILLAIYIYTLIGTILLQIKVLIAGFSSVICLGMVTYFLVIIIYSYATFECLSYADKGEQSYIHTDGYTKIVDGLSTNTIVSFCGWVSKFSIYMRVCIYICRLNCHLSYKS